MDQDLTEQHWDEGDTQLFIDLGRSFVPDRELQLELIADLIPPPEDGALILELCCGEGLLAEMLLERFPRASLLCYDGSAGMLEQARGRLARFGDRASFARFELAAPDWRTCAQPLHAVVSSLALHHLNNQQKQILYRDLYKLLDEDGVLLVADLIQPALQQALEVTARQWDAAVKQRSILLDGDTRAYDVFQRKRWNIYHHPDPLDMPSRLFDHLKWLDAAGFVDVDVFWLKAGHAIYGGRKASR